MSFCTAGNSLFWSWERKEKNRLTATTSTSTINLGNFIGILNYLRQQTKEMKRTDEYF
jgi:hypothetical protein